MVHYISDKLIKIIIGNIIFYYTTHKFLGLNQIHENLVNILHLNLPIRRQFYVNSNVINLPQSTNCHLYIYLKMYRTCTKEYSAMTSILKIPHFSYKSWTQVTPKWLMRYVSPHTHIFNALNLYKFKIIEQNITYFSYYCYNNKSGSNKHQKQKRQTLKLRNTFAVEFHMVSRNPISHISISSLVIIPDNSIQFPNIYTLYKKGFQLVQHVTNLIFYL